MDCFICGMSAREISECVGDYKHVECSTCGSYQISGSVHAMLTNRKFDTEAMRIQLNEMREKSKDIPLITSIQAKLISRENT